MIDLESIYQEIARSQRFEIWQTRKKLDKLKANYAATKAKLASLIAPPQPSAKGKAP